MLNEVLLLILLTLVPALEVRASIPYGILKTDLNLAFILLITIITNILIAPIVYFVLDKLIHIFLRIKVFEKIYARYVEKAQQKIRDSVDRYGLIGVAVFTGIPLPGTGVYTAAVGSYFIGLKFNKFIIAAVLGVLIAAASVTIITLSGNAVFNIFIKVI